MNRLQFDFLVNKEDHTLSIVREFEAEKQLVWDCYTKPELLEQWFAPKPFTAKTKSMDFRNGGHWHYAMISPEGDEYWGYTEYYDVQPIDEYKTLDAFSDSEGTINQSLPTAHWHVQFAEKGKNALVSTTVRYASLNDLEQVINMGMQEGMESTLTRLDELLNILKQ
ncbi:MAG: SRPBCC domain-containing protein [Microscillaceae bacterium]|jgi:uncharacterized protein YndB with AHSA1/START domain|nr:SRPBCC domain-containing protein [Microscillaceae bacterium]